MKRSDIGLVMWMIPIYILGSVVGPHPYPMMVRDFQRIIGDEITQANFGTGGRLPDAIVACVGGGSNAIGIFYPFIEDSHVRLIGVEAAGGRLDTERACGNDDQRQPRCVSRIHELFAAGRIRSGYSPPIRSLPASTIRESVRSMHS